MPRSIVTAVLLSALVVPLACGGGDARGAAAETDTPPATAGLSADELEHGVGPVRSVELGAIDEALAERGEQTFMTRCYACHRLAERYVAPQLGNVLERRTPEFVMNMMLNPAEMIDRHPVVQQLVAEYMAKMPNQNLTQDEARAILEYLRYEADEAREEADEH